MSTSSPTPGEPQNSLTVRVSHRRLLQLIRTDLESGPLSQVEIVAQYLGYSITPVQDTSSSKQYWDIVVRPVRTITKEK